MVLVMIMRATLKVTLCLGVREHLQRHFVYQVDIVFGSYIPVTLMSIFVVLVFGLFGTEVYLNFFWSVIILKCWPNKY